MVAKAEGEGEEVMAVEEAMEALRATAVEKPEVVARVVTAVALVSAAVAWERLMAAAVAGWVVERAVESTAVETAEAGTKTERP